MVKVHGHICKTIVSAHYHDVYLSQSFQILHAIDLGNDKTPIYFEFTRLKVKVTRATFVKNVNVSAHCLKNCFITELLYFTC